MLTARVSRVRMLKTVYSAVSLRCRCNVSAPQGVSPGSGFLHESSNQGLYGKECVSYSLLFITNCYKTISRLLPKSLMHFWISCTTLFRAQSITLMWGGRRCHFHFHKAKSKLLCRVCIFALTHRYMCMCILLWYTEMYVSHQSFDSLSITDQWKHELHSG